MPSDSGTQTQVVQAHLEMHETVIQVVETQAGVQKPLTDVQRAYFALVLVETKPGVEPPSSGKRYYSCGETRGLDRGGCQGGSRQLVGWFTLACFFHAVAHQGVTTGRLYITVAFLPLLPQHHTTTIIYPPLAHLHSIKSGLSG